MSRKLPATFLYAIALASLMPSCRKDKDLAPSPEGIVLDATTNNPIAGAWVVLVEYEPCGSWLCPEHVAGEDTTDGNGNYLINYEMKSDYGYYIKVIAPRYIESDRIASNEFEKIYLQPEAFLKVFIKNTTPYDPWDEISLNPYGTNQGGGGVIFQGMAIDTFTIGQVWGNRDQVINWWVTKNSVKTKYSTSVYCPAFDTTTYQLNY